MTPERWKRIEGLYHEALSRELADRPTFLIDACVGDDALRGEVESLLSHDQSEGTMLDEPALEITARQIAKDQTLKLIGRQIGSYRILSMVGAGGMGEVYLAEDATLDRRVAIKFLSQESQTDEQTRMRLIREAQAAAKLDHPNVCAIHEVGRHQGRSFIVMQYVEGETLATWIKSRPLSVPEVIDATLQIASALSEAHSHGIIHRDIKPQNMMLTPRGQIKVLDFGLAKLEAGEFEVRSEVNTQPLLTQPGSIPGTVPYMSPEQLRGEVLDARSDIFSLGAVLYQMLTLHRPFGDDNDAHTITAILEHTPPPVERFAEVPDELERIVSRCLEKDRERRYQSAEELARDLRAVLRAIDPDNASTRILSDATLVGGTRRARSCWLLAATLLLLVAVLGAVWFLRTPVRRIDSLAVLPFTTDIADQNLEYLGEQIAERIIIRLAELQNLKVIASSSSFKYRGGGDDSQAAGKRLGVRAVLTGRLIQRADKLSISAELVDVTDNRHLWGEQYPVREADLLGLEERIAQTISQQLRLQLSGSERERLGRRNTANAEAYQLYLKGRFYFSKMVPDVIPKAIAQFQEALQKDPNYALAYAGLADCYSGMLQSTEARRAATEALRLDDSLGEAHASLGFIKWLYDWDWAGAEAELKRAIELTPNYPLAHSRYALLLAQYGRHEEAIREARLAQEIDPVSPDIGQTSAIAFLLARDYKTAEEELQKTLEIDPRFPATHVHLALVFEQTGRYEEAIEAFQKVIELSGKSPQFQANIDAFITRVYAKRGNKAESMRMLNKLAGRSDVDPYAIAQIHAVLGNATRAFEWLDKAYEVHDVSLLGMKQDMNFEVLRQEPRFVELRRKIGFD